MSDHELPFTKRVDRNAMHSFFEYHQWDEELEEAYCRLLFDLIHDRMAKDPGLKAAYGPQFAEFPPGQHHHTQFHLNGHEWSVRAADLGNFLGKTILPTLSEENAAEVARQHDAKVAELDKEAEKKPHPDPDDIPAFRHT